MEGMVYMVQGCGVSAVCDSKEGVLYWVREMLERGGTPSIVLMAEPLAF